MWHFIVMWSRTWRRQDVMMTVFASSVIVGGAAALVDHGAWVLAPVLLGCALLWRTPLAGYPFDPGPDQPSPFVQPWERDARRAEDRARNHR